MRQKKSEPLNRSVPCVSEVRWQGRGSHTLNYKATESEQCIPTFVPRSNE